MGVPTASERIPLAVLNRVSPAARKTLDRVENFVQTRCLPADPVYSQMLGQSPSDRFSRHPIVLEDLKTEARKLGLWNMFLPKAHYAETGGYSNLEYGLMAEQLGYSRIASEATNCSAPDTGNMEVLAKYGNASQKKQWLQPLLRGEIRSAFLMTEPDIASSDATNIQFSIRRDGNDYVLNGSKWWSSGAGDPRCDLYIVMGKTDPTNASPHRQQSVLLVPSRTPGITVRRMLSVFGYDDAPHGHGHITFDNVRVPVKSSLVLGEGRGFEIIQGRLGPGRIHHTMRCIGAAERALDLMLYRLNDPRKKTFGKGLYEHEIMLARVADARVKIDAGRLTVLNAAIKIDEGDAKSALVEIAEAKILVPQILQKILDDAIQIYGAAGVSQDTALANMWSAARTMRLVDGPDEVHLLQLGRRENRRAKAVRERLDELARLETETFSRYGVERVDSLQMDWTHLSKPKL